MVRGNGVDGVQQPPPGLLSQLLRPPAAAKGPTITPQHQQQGGQDVLVKILAGMGPVSPGLQPPPMASHQPMSPTAQLLAARHDPMAGGCAHTGIWRRQYLKRLSLLCCSVLCLLSCCAHALKGSSSNFFFFFFLPCEGNRIFRLQRPPCHAQAKSVILNKQKSAKTKPKPDRAAEQTSSCDERHIGS